MIKRIVICSACLLVFCAPLPQATDLDKQTENTVEIKLSKIEIYNKCLQWMATTFVSSKRVVELQDSSQGIIIGNGIVNVTWQAGTFEMHFKIRIDIKDQKYRFKSFNYFVQSVSGPLGNAQNQISSSEETAQSSRMAKELADRTRDKINELDKSLYDYLTQNSKASDF
jgi:hypothetical protein